MVINYRPRWLAEKGRMEEGMQPPSTFLFYASDMPFAIAHATLARLHSQGNMNDPFVISQMEDIKVRHSF
jgi:hypothetical protein